MSITSAAIIFGILYSPLLLVGTFWRARQVPFVIAALTSAGIAILLYAAAGKWIWSAVWCVIVLGGLWVLNGAFKLRDARRADERIERMVDDIFRETDSR